MLTKPKPGVMIDPLHPLAKGLVGYWLFNEGAGDLAYDLSGNKNHGILKNMLPNTQGSKWQGSKFGGALTFDGQNDYVNCGNDASLNNLNTLTLEMWVKPTKSSTATVIAKKNMATGGIPYKYSYLIYLHSSQFRCIIGDGVSATNGGYSSTVTMGTWYHLVFTISASSLKIYLNGALDKTFSRTIDPAYAAYDVRIGIGYTETTWWYGGSIDGVKIYNRALGVEEVKTLYYDPFCNLLQVPAWQRYVPAAALSRTHGYIF